MPLIIMNNITKITHISSSTMSTSSTLIKFKFKHEQKTSIELINEDDNNHQQSTLLSRLTSNVILTSPFNSNVILSSPTSSSSNLVIFLLAAIYSSAAICNAKPPINRYQHHHHYQMQDKAILHVNLMNTIGLCRDPRPLIVYPPATAQKTYYPRGTLLHRCSDQIGCCPHPNEVCRPETVQEVEKVFFVHHFALGQKLAGGHWTRFKSLARNFTTATETLTLTNHTSCRCVKMAPDAIEHDELQSVVSRPLIKPSSSLVSMANQNSILYHIVGGLAALVILMILFFIFKWVHYHRIQRRP